MSATKQVEMDKMAMAIQHAVHVIRGEKSNTLVLNLGIQLSTNILLPLTAELEILSNLVEIPFQANCRSVRRSRHPVDLATL